MATFGNLIEQVYAFLHDDSRSYIRESDVEDWLNMGYLDLVARQEINHAETDEVTEAIGSDDNTIALPTGFIKLLGLRLEGGDDVELVSDEVWNSYADASATPEHTIARIYGSSIEMYPTPDAGTEYTLRFLKEPTTLDSAEDLAAVPTHLHRKLVYFATAHAHYQAGEYDGGDRFLGLYEDGLRPVATGREKYMPGPLAVIPTPGPFDTTEARHI